MSIEKGRAFFRVLGLEDRVQEFTVSSATVELAARALGKITGRIEVDDILDKIFGSFCIGK